MESYLYSFLLPYINIWRQNIQTSVLYEAFLPITSIKSRAGVTNYSKCMRSHVARDITMSRTARMVRLCSYKLKKQGVYFVPRIICPSVSICFGFQAFSFFQKELCLPFWRCAIFTGWLKIISLVFQFNNRDEYDYEQGIFSIERLNIAFTANVRFKMNNEEIKTA